MRTSTADRSVQPSNSPTASRNCTRLNARLAEVVMPDFPGVMDYEVSEPFGTWCRQNFHCDPKDRRAEARRLVDEFFDQGPKAR